MIRIFPNSESLMGLVRSIGLEIDELWMHATPYLDMSLPKPTSSSATPITRVI